MVRRCSMAHQAHAAICHDMMDPIASLACSPAGHRSRCGWPGLDYPSLNKPGQYHRPPGPLCNLRLLTVTDISEHVWLAPRAAAACPLSAWRLRRERLVERASDDRESEGRGPDPVPKTGRAQFCVDCWRQF